VTRSQALVALEAVGGDQVERLAGAVRAGPAVLDPQTEQRVEQAIREAHIRTSYGP
jgi:hypothetical protein